MTTATPPPPLLSRSPAWLCLLVMLSAQAQDDFFEPLDIEVEGSGSDRPYSVLGWATQKIGYGLQSPGPLFSRGNEEINRVETSVFAQLDASLGDNSQFRVSAKAYHDEVYRLQDDTPYSDAEISEFRNRFELRDFYLEHQTDNGFYLKAGNQMLAWGMAEYLRVSDLINIEDQYTFGQQDLEDLRLQVPALLASYSLGDWLLDAVVTWQAGRNRTAPAGDEFDPFIALRQGGPGLLISEPEQEHEVFVRASRSYSRGDVQVVAGEFNDNALSGNGVALLGDIPLLRFGQNRMQALAAAANWVSGPWLLFAEAGIHQNRSIQPDAQSGLSPVFTWERRDQILSVVGLEYSGIENLLISLEIDSIHISGDPLLTTRERDRSGYGLRFFWTGWNNRLEILGVWNDLGDHAGQVARVSVEYDLSDAFSLGLLWTGYDSEPESIFYAYRNNDVIELQLRYNFQF